MIMVARTTGTLHQYGLPKVALEMKHVVKCRPDRISLNSNSSRLAILDIDGMEPKLIDMSCVACICDACRAGVLTFFDPEAKRVNPETGAVVYGQTVEGFARKVQHRHPSLAYSHEASLAHSCLLDCCLDPYLWCSPPGRLGSPLG